jgi:hypothetical protein
VRRRLASCFRRGARKSASSSVGIWYSPDVSCRVDALAVTGAYATRLR